MTPEDKSEFRNLINEILDTRSRIDTRTHKEHHEFIDMLRQERQERHDMWEKVKSNTLGWFIIIVLGGIGTAVYQVLFKHK